MNTLSVYFKLHVLKQVYKWILLSSEMQHLACAGCVPQRRRKNPPFFRGFYHENGSTRSQDLQNHSRKTLKYHTLTLYLWKLSPLYGVQFMLLRDGWQTMTCRQHTHLNLWSVISKAMQHQTLTGGYCTWGYGNIVRQNKTACFAFAVVLFGILLMTELLIRGQCGGIIK
jgi:hypothetical protein